MYQNHISWLVLQVEIVSSPWLDPEEAGGGGGGPDPSRKSQAAGVNNKGLIRQPLMPKLRIAVPMQKNQGFS